MPPGISRQQANQLLPSVNVNMGQLKGLLPALERREVKQNHFVLDGRNFMLDFEGPKADFGNFILIYDRIRDPSRIQTFRINDDVFYFVKGAILRLDYTTQRFYPVYTFTDPGVDWPWSVAEVSGFYYFAKKGVEGILRYDFTDQSWSTVSVGVPYGMIGVVEAIGRLVACGLYYTAWSALDDGTDFVDSLTTGVGRQGHSIIGGRGYPLGILEVADGFIVYTKRGCYKGEQSDGVSPFRFYPISRDYIPLSQWCLANTENKENIILDKKGLFKQEVKAFTYNKFAPFQQVFSEFLTKKIFPAYNLDAIGGLIRLSYHGNQQRFFISLAQAAIDPIYTKSYVLDTQRDEWGSFDYIHYGFGEVNLSAGPLKGYNFGFWGTDGFIYKFTDDIFAEQAPELSDFYLWRPYLEYPIRTQDGTLIAATSMHCTAVNEADFALLSAGLYEVNPNVEYIDSDDTDDVPDYSDITLGSGPIFYDYMTTTDPDEDWWTLTGFDDYNTDGGSDPWYRFSTSMRVEAGVFKKVYSKYVAQSNSLNSFIEIGLLRIQQQQYDDEFSLITNVLIGGDSVSPGFTTEDYMGTDFLGDVFEDFETSTAPDEDWGFGFTRAVAYTASIRGSLDGYNTFEDQYEALTLESDRDRLRYFTCQNNGIYHSIVIEAFDVNQTYHLKSLELSGSLTGRL